MRVGFSISALKNGHQYRGIGFYTQNLLRSLKASGEVEVVEFEQLSEIQNVDLVHYPFFDLFDPTLPLIKKFLTVVTIHDVTPLIFPKHYPLGMRGKINFIHQCRSLKGVSKVITDSKSSQIDINRLLAVAKDKIAVVYLASFALGNHSTSIEKTDVNKKYNLPNAYVLYIGSVNWNKNILNITEASILAGVDLCIVGKDFQNDKNLNHPELADYQEFIKRYANHPKVHILGYVTDAELEQLVKLAVGLLLVSRYEGFGLPILMAQQLGTPVIAGNTSSMPEVGGNGALYVEPDNPDQIAQAISSLLNNQNLRNRLSELGQKNAKRFSWGRVVDQTIAVYREVCKSL